MGKDKEKKIRRDKMLRGIQLKALEWKILLNTRCNHNCWILSVILASRLSLKPSIFSLAFPTAFQLKRRYISEPFFFYCIQIWQNHSGNDPLTCASREAQARISLQDRVLYRLLIAYQIHPPSKVLVARGALISRHFCNKDWQQCRLLPNTAPWIWWWAGRCFNNNTIAR